MKKILLWGLASLLFLGLTLAGTGIYLLKNKGFFDPPDLALIQDARETSIVYDSTDQPLKEFCTFCREIIPLEEMGHFPNIAIAVEDKDFYTRGAVDARAIMRAVWQNWKAGEIQQGGSNATQQLSRMEFLEKELAEERQATGWEKRKKQLWRKGRELVIAIAIQKHFDARGERHKILELYLNSVYCGHGRHGVKACSRFYYGKNPSELSIGEAAMIAGTWRSPRSSPFKDKDEAKKLRARVLEQLAGQGLISQQEQNSYSLLPLPKPQGIDPCRAEHFAEFIRQQVTEKTRFVDRGRRTKTTLNCEWQKVASDALRSAMDAMKNRNPELAHDLRGAAFLIEVKGEHPGAIRVWAQEPSFRESEVLIPNIKRPVGSAGKAFFYGALLAKELPVDKEGNKQKWKLHCDDEGKGPCSLDDSSDSDRDGKSELYVYLGKNRGRHYIGNFPYIGDIPHYRGLIPPILALAESRNAATMSGMWLVKNSAVEQQYRVKREEVVAFAEKLGIPRQKVDPGETVALGSFDASAYEMTRAWTAFLNGELIEPYAIEEIEGLPELSRNTLPSPEESLEIIDEMTRLKMLRGLRATIEYIHRYKVREKGKEKTIERPVGTGKLALIGDQTRNIPKLDFQVMGKTGTATNTSGEATDNWFVGCSPSYCMAIWIGRENQKSSMKATPMKDKDGKIIHDKNGKVINIQESGGLNALWVFIETMFEIYQNRPKEFFPEITDPNRPFSLKREDEEETTKNSEAEEIFFGNDY